MDYEVDVSYPREHIYEIFVDRRWLFEHGLPHVVTHLLHNNEFDAPLGNIYTKSIAHGHHYGLMLGVEVSKAGRTPHRLPSYKHSVVEDLCEFYKGDGVI